MTIVYHGTQTRHLPGIFSSGKIFGYWTSSIQTAISFTLIMGPPDNEQMLLPPNQHAVILAVESDTVFDFETGGDPTWFTPINGFIEVSRVTHGLRYNGPELSSDLSKYRCREDQILHDVTNWKNITVKQLRRFTRRKRSFFDGMLFVEPDPFALAFKQIVSERKHDIRSVEFMGQEFHHEKTLPLYEISEDLQHDCDNTIDVILIFEDSETVRKYVSDRSQMAPKNRSAKELLQLELKYQRRSYCIT